MNYQFFKKSMVALAEYIELVCSFRDSEYADSVECEDEEQAELKEEMLLTTELFDLDNFARAIRYYTAKNVVIGKIHVKEDKYFFVPDGSEKEICLKSNTFFEVAVSQADTNCYEKDEIFFWNLARLKDIDDSDIDGIYIRMRMSNITTNKKT